MRIDSTSLAGLWANETKFAKAANNVANVNTEDYAGGPVDLAEEFPMMTVAEIGYTANARVVRTQDETTKSLIDELA
jgi:flagellar hook protein FlgE